ncbi:hypothetical protein [Haloarcula marina]|uniref:hypothetical protein n=1 Tax=Haloarcula marina TaxID=2961574 RepID=UPI0020B6C5AF|nr:hypothetical protein [Halomicroarcula marina]
MSEADTDESDPGAAPVDAEDGPESESVEEDDRPEIEGEEKADVDLDALGIDSEEIEAEAGAQSDDQADDDGDEATDDGDEQADEMPDPLEGIEGESWGDQYVTMLALVLGEVAEQSDGETGKTAEDIEELARAPPVELDQQVDEWLAQSGVGQDIPPGQALALGTLGIALVVILTETDLAKDAMDALSGELTDALNF